MAISEKQLAANRANAKKSTGPKTPKGKAVCRMNGWQHGCTGLAVVTTDEDRETWMKFSTPFIASLRPVGPDELEIAQNIAIDQFRLRRIKAVEENTFAYGELGPIGDKIDAQHPRVHHALAQGQTFVVNQKAFTNISLYEQRITRNIHKNRQLLREEQALRKAETHPLTRTASTTTEENGSAFSNVLVTPVRLPNEAAAGAFETSGDLPKAA